MTQEQMQIKLVMIVLGIIIAIAVITEVTFIMYYIDIKRTEHRNKLDREWHEFLMDINNIAYNETEGWYKFKIIRRKRIKNINSNDTSYDVSLYCKRLKYFINIGVISEEKYKELTKGKKRNVKLLCTIREFKTEQFKDKRYRASKIDVVVKELESKSWLSNYDDMREFQREAIYGRNI